MPFRVDPCHRVAQPGHMQTPAPRNQRACAPLHYGYNPGEGSIARATDEHGIRCSLAMEMSVRKLTVRGLAAATGVSTGAISKLRAGHFSMIDCLNLERICRYLKLDPGQLLYLDPPLNEPNS